MQSVLSGPTIRPVFRTVFDLAEHQVRLQAPEGWTRLQRRADRIVLRDLACPTPIFVEPLPRVSDVDDWIRRFSAPLTAVTRYQRTADGEARRFVVTGTGNLERGYCVRRVRSSQRSAALWISASIDIEGERGRLRRLTDVFPPAGFALNVVGEGHVRQYLECGPQSAESASGPGWTLKLPAEHSIREREDDSFLIYTGEARFGWMTLRVEPAAANASADAEIVFSDGTSGSDAPDAELRVPCGERQTLVLSLVADLGPEDVRMFVRRAHRGLRIWDDAFRGHWKEPARTEWIDAAIPPAPPRPQPTPVMPPPAAPPPDPGVTLQAEWDARLSGRELRFVRTAAGPGYDPGFSFGGYREEEIVLQPNHQVRWDQVVHTSASIPGLYIGGPTRTRRTGVWRIEIQGRRPQLVLSCGSEGGVHRFDVAADGPRAVTLDGRRYRF